MIVNLKCFFRSIIRVPGCCAKMYRMLEVDYGFRSIKSKLIRAFIILCNIPMLYKICFQAIKLNYIQESMGDFKIR